MGSLSQRVDCGGTANRYCMMVNWSVNLPGLREAVFSSHQSLSDTWINLTLFYRLRMFEKHMTEHYLVWVILWGNLPPSLRSFPFPKHQSDHPHTYILYTPTHTHTHRWVPVHTHTHTHRWVYFFPIFSFQKCVWRRAGHQWVVFSVLLSPQHELDMFNSQSSFRFVADLGSNTIRNNFKDFSGAWLN